MKKKIYALYKGDEFIYVGTIKEIAKHTGIKENTIRFYSSPAYKKRIKKKDKKLLIKVE